jgi:hypothetical protein
MPTATRKGNTRSRLLRVIAALAMLTTGISAYAQHNVGRLEQDATGHHVVALAKSPPGLPRPPLSDESAFPAEEFTPVAESPTWVAAILATAYLVWSAGKRWKKFAWVRIRSVLRSQFNWLAKRNELPEQGMRTPLAAK